MKKYFFSILALAVAAMTTVSCSNDNDIFGEQQNNKGEIVLIAGNPDIESDTRTELGADGITPMWSSKDQIKGFGNGYDLYAPTLLTFNRSDEQANKASKTAIFKMEANSTWTDEVCPYADKLYFYHAGTASQDINSDTYACTGKISFKMKEEQNPKSSNQFDSSADILVAKPVAYTQEDYSTDPITLQFKRVSGIIRLNLIDATKDKSFYLNKGVDYITLTTGDKSNDFVGELSGDMNTGVFDKKTSHTYQKLLKVSPSSYKVGENGSNSIYMSVLPTKLAAGTEMTLKVYFNDGFVFEKILKAPAKGINVEAGRITTFNVSFKDNDVPAQGSATIVGDVITMNGVGELQVTDVQTALSNSTASPKRIVINGDINASDINSILYVVRNSTDMIDLDLTGANIKGNGTSSYTDHNGKAAKISHDNTLPAYLFAKCNSLTSVELPKSLVSIGNALFYMNTGISCITIQHNVTTIDGSMFDSDCTAIKTVYALCKMSESFNGLCIDGDDYGISLDPGIDLYLNRDWENDGASNEGIQGLWGSTMFSNVTFVDVDANGNIIAN